jgi:hypothetical protein
LSCIYDQHQNIATVNKSFEDVATLEVRILELPKPFRWEYVIDKIGADEVEGLAWLDKLERKTFALARWSNTTTRPELH